MTDPKTQTTKPTSGRLEQVGSTPTPGTNSHTTPWEKFENGMPPKHIEVELLSKCGMQTKGIHGGGKGWSDGIRSTGHKLYEGDYLVAWRLAA